MAEKIREYPVEIEIPVRLNSADVLYMIQQNGYLFQAIIGSKVVYRERKVDEKTVVYGVTIPVLKVSREVDRSEIERLLNDPRYTTRPVLSHLGIDDWPGDAKSDNLATETKPEDVPQKNVLVESDDKRPEAYPTAA